MRMVSGVSFFKKQQAVSRMAGGSSGSGVRTTNFKQYKISYSIKRFSLVPKKQSLFETKSNCI